MYTQSQCMCVLLFCFIFARWIYDSHVFKCQFNECLYVSCSMNDIFFFMRHVNVIIIMSRDGEHSESTVDALITQLYKQSGAYDVKTEYFWFDFRFIGQGYQLRWEQDSWWWLRTLGWNQNQHEINSLGIFSYIGGGNINLPFSFSEMSQSSFSHGISAAYYYYLTHLPSGQLYNISHICDRHSYFTLEVIHSELQLQFSWKVFA